MVTRTAMQQYEEEERAILYGVHEARSPAGQGDQSTGAASMNGQMTKKGGEFSNLDLMLCSVLEAIVVICGSLRHHMHSCKLEVEGMGEPRSCTHPLAVFFFGG